MMRSHHVESANDRQREMVYNAYGKSAASDCGSVAFRTWLR
jgi:hypothetical protein